MDRLQERIEAIDDALDTLAQDPTISLAAYAEAMEEIASRVATSARAAQDDLMGR